MRARGFYGWNVVAATSVMALFSFGLGFYGLSVYVATLQRQHGWSASTVSTPVTVYYLAGALLTASIGDLYARWGPRAVVAGGSVAMAAVAGRLAPVWPCKPAPPPSSCSAPRAGDRDGYRRTPRVDSRSTILDSMSIMKERAAEPVIQDINARIAGRVRGLRADLGMTLDALAAQCDVSRSMISLVERGESSPTAVVLEKIASGLGVSLATLFEDSNAPADPVSRRDDRVPWRDPQSGYVRRNISPANFPSPIQIVEIVLPAGASVAYETGARDVSMHQQIWVQEGSVEVTLGRVTYRLSEDDCLAMQLNEPTAFRNRTRRPARYLVVVATERSRASRR
jgi:transcriptional regulator with XRE-family HTH domain